MYQIEIYLLTIARIIQKFGLLKPVVSRQRENFNVNLIEKAGSKKS